MTNAMTDKIMEYRFIGKTQLNADDMGGVGCANWDNYLTACNLLATSAWDHIMGRSIDDNIVNTCIAGLFDFFGIEVVDSRKYFTRILSIMVTRKANRSDELKDAIKSKTKAKNAWSDAIVEEKSEEEVAELKAEYEKKCEEVDHLYTIPNNYWFDPAPMFDKKTKKATPKARKALEDTMADIYSERKFMTADELQKEAQALADQRRGRKERAKAEKKSAKKEEAKA